jgi:hypothetical protein
MVGRRHSIPFLGHFSGVLWGVPRFLGGQTGIVLKNKRLKKGYCFRSISSFGVVFGGV